MHKPTLPGLSTQNHFCCPWLGSCHQRAFPLLKPLPGIYYFLFSPKQQVVSFLAPELPSLPPAESWGAGLEGAECLTSPSAARRAGEKHRPQGAATPWQADLEPEPPTERGDEGEEPRGEYSQFASSVTRLVFLLCCNQAERGSRLSSSTSKVSRALPSSLMPPLFSLLYAQAIWKRKVLGDLDF